jgi:uracil-DNA glycosylase
MQFNLNLSWKSHLNQEFSLNYFQTLEHFLEKEFSKKIIYPAKENIFNALNATSFEKTKVIILGQDPYHQPNQAHGLSFSVGKNVKIPPSLQNIFKEIESDLNKPSILKNGDLSSWAEQGVLLLNSILTVEESRPLSHQNMGWEIFTDKIIQVLDQEKINLCQFRPTRPSSP